MEQTIERKIFFADSPRDCNFAHSANHILHILCTKGSMSFTFQEVCYNILAGDYIILPNPSLASGFSESEDFEGIVMTFSELFATSLAIRSNYGVVGFLALMQNPVMHLASDDFSRCRDDMMRLRQRTAETHHLFYEELIESLLTAHVLDLYDIHARTSPLPDIPERAASLTRQFIGLLCRGDYVTDRSLEHYARILCVTPHYLSEACRKTGSRPASHWIERFTLQHIVGLLNRKELSLGEIADRMNFSSLSYFSRYVQKRLGFTPSEYRNRRKP